MHQYTVGKCLNCDAAVPNRRSLYCGERCRQIAELVRYARRKLAEGTYDRPDIAEAITIRRGLLIGGSFYDKRGRAVNDEVREELLARSHGRCEKCGHEFTPEGDARFTVQHSAGDEGFLLEAWCYRCNMDHVLATARPIESAEQLLFGLEFEHRVHAPTPLLLCDDPVNWPTLYLELQRAIRSRGDVA